MHHAVLHRQPEVLASKTRGLAPHGRLLAIFLAALYRRARNSTIVVLSILEHSVATSLLFDTVDVSPTSSCRRSSVAVAEDNFPGQFLNRLRRPSCDSLCPCPQQKTVWHGLCGWGSCAWIF